MRCRWYPSLLPPPYHLTHALSVEEVLSHEGGDAQVLHLEPRPGGEGEGFEEEGVRP